jgi:hypothetical protein
VRPEGLSLQASRRGAGIVTTRTFLGSLTRVGVLLSEETTVQVDVASSAAADIQAGDAVDVRVTGPVLIAPR